MADRRIMTNTMKAVEMRIMKTMKTVERSYVGNFSNTQRAL